MLRLAKAFLEIALWRKTPAYLPASPLLLALTACVAALLEVLGAILLPDANGGVLASLLLGVLLPLGFAWAVLALAKLRQRYLQTASALLGVGVLADILLDPLSAAIHAMGQDRLLSNPVGLLLYAALIVGLVWYLLVCAHIWRSALDTGLLLGGAVSVGYFVLATMLQLQFAPSP